MPSNPWHPFLNCLDFEFADIHFSNLQSSKSEINQVLDFWLATTMHAGGNIDDLPWSTADQMYRTIDLLRQVQYHGKPFDFIILAPSFLECLQNGHCNLMSFMSFASVIHASSCRTSSLNLTFMIISIMSLTCSLTEEWTVYGQTWCQVLGPGKKR